MLSWLHAVLAQRRLVPCSRVTLLSTAIEGLPHLPCYFLAFSIAGRLQGLGRLRSAVSHVNVFQRMRAYLGSCSGARVGSTGLLAGALYMLAWLGMFAGVVLAAMPACPALICDSFDFARSIWIVKTHGVSVHAPVCAGR